MNKKDLIKYVKEGLSVKVHDQEELDGALLTCSRLNILWCDGKAVLDSKPIVFKFPVLLHINFAGYPGLSIGEEMKFGVNPWSCIAKTFIGADLASPFTTTTSTVKVDYVQLPCPVCGEPMRALWRLDDQYCPNGCQ